MPGDKRQAPINVTQPWVQWSEDNRIELERNLMEDGVAPKSVSRLLEQMQRAFPDARVLG